LKLKIKNLKLRKAQSLIEILIALALGVVLIGGSVTLMGVSLRGYRSFKNYLQAIISTRQAMEITQAIIRANWHSISDLTPGIHYKIAKRGNSYTFQKGEEKVFDDTNLVSYWNMDEGSGQIAYDNKNTNNGILINSPTWKSGSDCVSSSCLEFNGTTNYVNCGNNLNLVLSSTPATLEVWIKGSFANGNQIILGHYASGIGLGIYASPAENHFIVRVGNVDNTKLTFNVHDVWIDDVWNHIVVTYDESADSTFWLNGVQVTSTGPNNYWAWDVDEMLIGKRSTGTYFNGSIDEVRIYDTALTAEQIREHYKAGLDKLGLVGYWSMDENGDTTAYDNANSNNGTIYNSPTWKSSSDCVSGSCLEFSVSTNYVSAPNNATLNITNAITIESWVNLTTGYSSSHKMIASKGNPAWYFSIFNQKVFFSPWIDGAQTYTQGTKIVSAEEWHHVACSWDSTTNKYRTYLDGLIDVDTTKVGNSLSTTTSSFLMSAFVSQGDYPFTGKIDEVRIYNRALTEQEINNRYQAGYTRYIVFNKVSRTSGNINTTYSSSNDDSSTLKAISIIKYGEGLVSEQSGGLLSVANYFTRSENSKVFHQTDWLGGSGVTGPVSNPSNEYDTSSNLTVSTVGQITLTDTESAGELTSSIFDTGVSNGAGFNSLLWQGSLGTGGAVKFQIAFSNDEDGPWTYYGPTSTSDWYQPNPDISASFPTVGTASPQNKRYVRYKINLSTASTTPTINDIIINWAP